MLLPERYYLVVNKSRRCALALEVCKGREKIVIIRLPPNVICYFDNLCGWQMGPSVSMKCGASVKIANRVCLSPIITNQVMRQSQSRTTWLPEIFHVISGQAHQGAWGSRVRLFLQYLRFLWVVHRSRSGGCKIGGTYYKEPILWTETK
jgi:hypothetical protein